MESLFERAQKKILLTAHGGYNGGIITFNSLMGFETAVRAGADVIEIDLARSAEGKLYVFHPGTEKRMLGMDCDITKMTKAEIEALRTLDSRQPIPSLDALLETFKGRCYINTDKAYTCFPELVKAIRRHGVEDQIILKGEVKDTRVYDMTEALAPDIAFLAVSYETDHALEICKSRNIHYVGSEVVFREDNAPVTEDSYIAGMHRNGKVLWVNPIRFSLTRPLTGGHDDHASLLDDPAKGWGWLADKGYDIFQTDWLTDCRVYLEKSGKLYRQRS